MEHDGAQAAREATEALTDGVVDASSDVVAALLGAGADPKAYDTDRGMSALRRAVRAGRDENAALIVRAGATDDSDDIDRFLGACVHADRQSAEQLLAEHPDLRDRMTEDDRATVVETAGSGSAAGVGLMLDLGFSPHARNSFGEQPLHAAARHLRAAYRDHDLALLGPLLHPRVQWTGVCTNSGEVLDWYRNLLADGIQASVESVEVDRDAVVVGLSLSRPAEGARPAPPERRYQVFTVENTQ